MKIQRYMQVNYRRYQGSTIDEKLNFKIFNRHLTKIMIFKNLAKIKKKIYRNFGKIEKPKMKICSLALQPLVL